MLTKPQLADLLRDVNVEAVATAAGVSTKTIYRLRHQASNPSLDMVERIVRAVDALRPKRKRQPAPETAQ